MPESWDLYNKYRVGRGVNKADVCAKFVLNGTAICPPKHEDVIYAYLDAYRIGNAYDLWFTKETFPQFTIRVRDDGTRTLRYVRQICEYAEYNEAITIHSTRRKIMYWGYYAGPWVVMHFDFALHKQNVREVTCKLRELIGEEMSFDTFPMPYTPGQPRYTEYAKEMTKTYGIGYGVKRGHATHFSRSPHGIVHYAFDARGKKEMIQTVCDLYERGEVCYFNEIITVKDRFKFFVECDGPPSDYDAEHFGECLTKAVRCVVGNSHDLRYMVFSACSSEKTSYHVRYPSFMVTKDVGSMLTEQIKRHITDQFVRNSIDSCPMTGSLTQLRMPYCDKPSKVTRSRANRPLVLVHSQVMDNTRDEERKLKKRKIVEENLFDTICQGCLIPLDVVEDAIPDETNWCKYPRKDGFYHSDELNVFTGAFVDGEIVLHEVRKLLRASICDMTWLKEMMSPTNPFEASICP